MTLDDDARVYLRGDLTIGVDPATSAVLLEVDGVVYPASWEGAAVETSRWDPCRRATVTGWVRTARTDQMWIGSSRTPIGGDVQLAAGTHAAQWLVTLADGEVVPGTAHTLVIA